MSNSPVGGQTSEERHKLIAEQLRIFELPQESIDWICSRMVFYLENFLCAPTIHIDFQQFLGLSPDQITKIQKAFSQMGNEIWKWKDSIYRERLFLEVAFVHPEAIARVSPEDRGKLF